MAPAAPGTAAPRNALSRHFQSATVATATTVRGRLADVRTDINSRTTLNVQCNSASDTDCNASGAYVSGSLLVFCPTFFNGSALWQSETIIHEMSHALVGGDHITDRAYQSDRIYPLLTTAQALTNAESFGLLVQELGRRRAQQNCAPGHLGRLSRGLASAYYLFHCPGTALESERTDSGE